MLVFMYLFVYLFIYYSYIIIIIIIVIEIIITKGTHKKAKQQRGNPTKQRRKTAIHAALDQTRNIKRDEDKTKNLYCCPHWDTAAALHYCYLYIYIFFLFSVRKQKKSSAFFIHVLLLSWPNKRNYKKTKTRGTTAPHQKKNNSSPIRVIKALTRSASEW